MNHNDKNVKITTDIETFLSKYIESVLKRDWQASNCMINVITHEFIVQDYNINDIDKILDTKLNKNKDKIESTEKIRNMIVNHLENERAKAFVSMFAKVGSLNIEKNEGYQSKKRGKSFIIHPSHSLNNMEFIEKQNNDNDHFLENFCNFREDTHKDVDNIEETTQYSRKPLHKNYTFY